MGLKITCDGCGSRVFSSLSKVGNRYLCSACAANPNTIPNKYFCNSCKNYTPKALKKGNGWIELVLYLFYLVPGIIYSIWRRSGQPNVCPVCKTAGLVPITAAKLQDGMPFSESRDEIECPFCAEKI